MSIDAIHIAQRAERAALRIKEGHRADTRHTVAHPGAEAVLAVLILLRLCAQFDRAAAALDGQRRGVLAVFCQKLTEFLNGVQALPADGRDDVALLQPRRLRGRAGLDRADLGPGTGHPVGGAAAAAAFAGESGRMIALKRVSNYPYQCITESVDVQQVANLEKKVPLEWITPDGMQVTEAFEEYARPLILDEVTPVYVNGTPRHIRL